MKNYKNEVEEVSKWLKNYMDNGGFKGFVLGLSGGIDSAVSLGIAIQAIGKENIKCFALPCHSKHENFRMGDLDDAKLVADHFGVDLEVVDLDETIKVYYENRMVNHNKENRKLVLPNIKARLRMTTLRALAECYGYLVLGTTNKTEEYLGYYTKAGDGGAGVDIEPIADYFKYEIRELARALGVPNSIIEKAPSAGLWDNQTDEGEIGFTYDEIDKYLSVREEYTGNVAGKYEPSHLDMGSYGGIDIYHDKFDMVKMMMSSPKVKALRVSDGLIEKVERMISVSGHKRVNPPYFKHSTPVVI